ncbi:MAG: hypothetical protein JWM86_233, partial [Thermoleophilia bacterium]|nr:hypothetical protein [Thermoleophilia bacterium]
FLGEMRQLEFKAGPLLVQLPPSFAFDLDLVDRFLTALRTRWSGPVAVEPRHVSWFTGEADELLIAHCAARVAADPARTEAAAEPGGWPGLVYVRLHGSPRTYYSSYDDNYLAALADRLRDAAAADATDQVWCIFDNTASGAALQNALDMKRLLLGEAEPPAFAAPRLRYFEPQPRERPEHSHG